jgi:hypothetical protein
MFSADFDQCILVEFLQYVQFFLLLPQRLQQLFAL